MGYTGEQPPPDIKVSSTDLQHHSLIGDDLVVRRRHHRPRHNFFVEPSPNRRLLSPHKIVTLAPSSFIASLGAQNDHGEVTELSFCMDHLSTSPNNCLGPGLAENEWSNLKGLFFRIKKITPFGPRCFARSAVAITGEQKKKKCLT